VSFPTFFLLIWAFIRFVSIFSTCEGFHHSTSSSSSTSSVRKSVVINILSPLRTSTSLGLSLRFLPFFFWFLVSILGNYLASGLTSSLASLTFLVVQILLNFQSHMISIFHHSDGHHAHLILNFVSQTIHVPSNFFIIAFPMTYYDV
jgi:hypothetical protein